MTTGFGSASDAPAKDLGPFSGLRHDRPRRREGNTETERTILDAAEALLGTHGFDDLSVSRIIDESGLSRATFYHYFSSRLSVVAGLLDRVMEELLEVASPFLLRPGLALADSIALSIETAVRIWAEHRPLLSAVMENWTSDAGLEVRWVAAMDRFTAAVALEIEEARRGGKLGGDQPSRELAAVLVWSTERTLHVAGRGVVPEFPDEAAVVAPLVQLWSGALGIERG